MEPVEKAILAGIMAVGRVQIHETFGVGVETLSQRRTGPVLTVRKYVMRLRRRLHQIGDHALLVPKIMGARLRQSTPVCMPPDALVYVVGLCPALLAMSTVCLLNPLTQEP